MFIKREDITAIEVNGNTVCMECAKDEDWVDLKAEDIHTENSEQDETYIIFCDRCKKQI